MSPVARNVLKQLFQAVDEEAAAQVPYSDTTSQGAGDKTTAKKMNAALQTISLLAVLSAIIVFTHNFVLDGMSNSHSGSSSQARQLESLSAEEIEAHATWLANDFRESYTFAESAEGEADQQRRLQLDVTMTETLKITWPECVKFKMTGKQCKKYINDELLTLFTGQDRLVEKASALETEVIPHIAGQHNGITITVTTETKTITPEEEAGSPGADSTEPASGPTLEDGNDVVPQELVHNADPGDSASSPSLRDGNGAVLQDPAEVNDDYERVAELERKAVRALKRKAVRGHRRIKARKRAARKMAAEVVGSE